MNKALLLARTLALLVGGLLAGCSASFDKAPAEITVPVAGAAAARLLGCPEAAGDFRGPSPAGGSASGAFGQQTVFRGVSLLAMTGAPVQQNMTIVVQDTPTQ